MLAAGALMAAPPARPISPSTSVWMAASTACLVGRRRGDDLLGQRGPRLEVVGGAQEGRLVGAGRRHLGDDLAAEDDDHAVAGELDLLQLRGVEEDGCAGRGQVAQQDVDLGLGADVDPARGVEAQHRLDAAGDPARDRHLLLVPAGEAPHLAAGAGVDLERGDGLVDLLALAAQVDPAPLRHARRERQRDVLADRALHQQRLRPVGGDEDHAHPDRVGGVPEGNGLAVDRQGAGRRPLGARQQVEELVLPLALQGDHPEDLARVEVEGGVVQATSVAERLGADARLPLGLVGRGRDRRHLLAERDGAFAEHQVDDLVLRAGGHVDDADGLAVAQDRGAIADRRDLDQAVRDEDDRPVVALLLDHPEHQLGQVGRERRGDLVEQQHVGLDRQRTGQVDDAERGERQPPREARQAQVPETQLVQPVAERLQRCRGEPQVVADVEIRDDRGLLVDGHEPVAARVGRRVRHALAAPDDDPAAVRRDRAGQDLDERALAGAVGAHQRVDLAGSDRQRRVVERDHGAVRLGDVGRLEQQVGGGDGCGSGHRPLG